MFLYVLRSRDWPDRKYVGVTSNFERRFEEHNQGKNYATYKFRQWRCEVKIWFERSHMAEQFEQYLKSGSGRAFAQKRFWEF
ncbi:MAG: GIY-YIG nuclease family protein [Deltaproteobacteria bacterium]|nr:GIY-YIG nuclease family protein [Deltaproteobacteria bacterium]